MSFRNEFLRTQNFTRELTNTPSLYYSEMLAASVGLIPHGIRRLKYLGGLNGCPNTMWLGGLANSEHLDDLHACTKRILRKFAKTVPTEVRVETWIALDTHANRLEMQNRDGHTLFAAYWCDFDVMEPDDPDTEYYKLACREAFR